MEDSTGKKGQDLRDLWDGLAEAALELSPESLGELYREEGQDPGAVTAHMRSLLDVADRRIKRERLDAARSLHQVRVRQYRRRQSALPSDPSERRRLLEAMLTRRPELRQGLTLHYREFSGMTDEEVESSLRQLAALGILVMGEEAKHESGEGEPD